jgi:hypothetical protein
MIYTKTISEAAGGSASAPTRRDMFVTTGLIYQFECYFPPGSSGLLHVAVFDGGFQLWPSEPEETFFGDNTLISFPDRYYIVSPRKALTILSWNEDDTYAHSFQIRIGQVSAEVFIASFLPSMSMDKMTEQIAAVAQEKEKASEVSMEEALTTFDQYED